MNLFALLPANAGEFLRVLFVLGLGTAMSLAVLAVLFFVVYRVVRSAVRDGIRDARKEGPL